MNTFKRILMWPVYIVVLRPLIAINYKQRELGNIPDQWYWADELAVKYGFYQCLILGFMK